MVLLLQLYYVSLLHSVTAACGRCCYGCVFLLLYTVSYMNFTAIVLGLKFIRFCDNLNFVSYHMSKLSPNNI
ncbi:hypothetical protein RND81_05G087800 [Saponaria officinalis]|uniref:Uncharacterized protein n=1 Tax=Saponaria officinalis TaxID=3572 RepID=A0AAW1KVH3_SAPOF